MLRIIAFCLAAQLAAASTLAAAQAPADTARAVLASYMEAWAHADAHALGARFAADGDFISPTGSLASGPAQIEAFYAAAFQRGYAGSHAAFTPVQVRLLAPGVIAVDGEWSIAGAHGPDGAALTPEAGIATAVLVERRGRWRVALLREQASARRITPSGR